MRAWFDSDEDHSFPIEALEAERIDRQPPEVDIPEIDLSELPDDLLD
jgi:hypothetical protein